MGGEDGAEEITANSPGRVDCITPRGEKEKEGGAEESREPGWGETGARVLNLKTLISGTFVWPLTFPTLRFLSVTIFQNYVLSLHISRAKYPAACVSDCRWRVWMGGRAVTVSIMH